jgi:hypothetical protein
MTPVSKHKALNTTPSTAKNKRKEERRDGKEEGGRKGLFQLPPMNENIQYFSFCAWLI